MNNSAVLTLFQKFHREFCLLLLVLLGLACGQLAATLTGALIRPDTAAMPSDQVGTTIVNSELSSHDLNQILQQNIFDPSARGTRPAAFKSKPIEKNSKKASRKGLLLIGTLVAGEESIALLEINKKIQLFHLDDSLPGSGKIEDIQRNKVTIRNSDESTTELVLREEMRKTSAKGSKAPTVSGIRSVGENRWAVSRNTADAARTNIAEQLRLAQMEPRIVNGITDGFLVRKLYTKSLLVQMGIRRGDVILRVNNMTLDSPEKALQVLQQLREARQLTVDLERNDEPMTFAYEIN